MDVSFRTSQEKWLHQLLQSDALCDAIAVVGPEAKRIPVHRAILANISEPWEKMFFGDFREGVTQEVVLPEVDVHAFACIQKAAVGLNPGLNPENVVPTLLAAEQYMIQSLADECHRWMRHDVTPADVLTVMTSCLTCGCPMNEDTERSYWEMIVDQSELVVKSPSFLLTDSRIMKKLVQLNELGIKEEVLWSRLLEWAACSDKDPHLAASLCNTLPHTSEEKRDPTSELSDEQSYESGSGSHQTTALKALLQHVHFPAMDKDFFADKAASYLTRDEERSVLLFHLLGREPQFTKSIRIFGPQLQEISFNLQPDNSDLVQKLKEGKAEFAVTYFNPGGYGRSYNSLAIELPSGHPAVAVSKVCLTFVHKADHRSTRPQCASSFELQTSDGTKKTASACCTSDKITQEIPLNVLPPARSWQLKFTGVHSDDAKLAGLRLHGILERKSWVQEVVKKNGSLLLQNVGAASVALGKAGGA